MPARLTVRELGAQLTILAICLWLIAGVNACVRGPKLRSGQIKGADFLHFYVIGSLALRGDAAALYDPQRQAAEQERVVPESRGQWFVPVYGPQVALFFAPFAMVGYFQAAALWCLANCLLYAFSLSLIFRHCRQLKGHLGLVALAGVAYPPFWQLVLHGQTSALPLVAVTVAFPLLVSRRFFAAGCALGLLAVKPQLAIVLGLLLLTPGGWRVAAGALLVFALQFGIAAVVLGVGVVRDYATAMIHLGRIATLLEPKSFQLHSLRGFWQLLLPSWPLAASTLYGVSAIAAAAAFVTCWRSGAPLALRYAGLLVTMVLISPHLTVYDLVLLAPGLLLLADYMVGRRSECDDSRLAALMYLFFASTLLGPLAAVTRVQISVVLLLLMLWVVSTLARKAAQSLVTARVGTTLVAAAPKESR